MERIKRFFKDEEGVTAIEYGLIAAGIALAIIAVVFVVGYSTCPVPFSLLRIAYQVKLQATPGFKRPRYPRQVQCRACLGWFT